jgi:cell division transport system permease protein
LESRNIKRRRVSYASTTVSITFVLFLVGLFGLMSFHASQLKDFLKENIQVSIYFLQDVDEGEIQQVRNQVTEQAGVTRTAYTSKEEAQELMARNLGEEADDVLGYNPYPPSLDVYFEADYARADTLKAFREDWQEHRLVRDVYYQEVLVSNVNRYVQIAGVVLVGLAAIFGFIAFTLINSTIRLNLYAKRFLIKSMQLVGATRWFIRRPFILRAMRSGLTGGLIASVLLGALLVSVRQWLPFVGVQEHLLFYGALALFLALLGIVITGVASLVAVNKYLRMRLDDLF